MAVGHWCVTVVEQFARSLIKKPIALEETYFIYGEWEKKVFKRPHERTIGNIAIKFDCLMHRSYQSR